MMSQDTIRWQLCLACAKTWTGLWTMDCGLWTVDCGLWTVDYGLWTVDYGLWTVDCVVVLSEPGGRS